MKIYTGIGARSTPMDVLTKMRTIAKHLADKNYLLRSGGAGGADTAFEDGAKDNIVINARGSLKIYLPWKSYNNRTGNYQWEVVPNCYDPYAVTLSKQFHPYWHKLGDAVRKLMTRNCYQVLGDSLDLPSDFVVCWTPDGCETHESRTIATGGTGQAISIASSMNIPVYNLFNKDRYEEIMDKK